MTGYYKIVPSRTSRYIPLREGLKKYYEVIGVNGEWLALSIDNEPTGHRLFAITVDYDASALILNGVDDPIDIRDLEQAIEKKKRRRTEWQEAT